VPLTNLGNAPANIPTLNRVGGIVVGQVLRLRKFEPPLPGFVSKRNRPIKLTLELVDDPAVNIAAANHLITELMWLVNCEIKAPTAAERRRHVRHAKQRLADRVLPPGLEQFPIDPGNGAWHLHWYPARRPDTAA